MSWNVQIQGGPRDGEIVPYQGPWLRMPVTQRVVFHVEPDSIPLDSHYWIDEYKLERGDDMELYYVRQATRIWLK